MVVAVALALACAGSAYAADSVTYQANPQHTGAVDEAIGPALGVRWALDMGAESSYPVIAGGKVFVTTKTTGSGYGSTLSAIDANSGAVVWSRQLAHTYYWSALAYENGRLFALDYDGVLQAFAADTGAVLWGKQLPGQYAFSSAPVATGGVVYTGGAGSGGTVYAVRESDGQVLWTQPVMNGDDSSPSVDGSHVFVSYACSQAYSFAVAGGTLAWHHSTGCEGGGGKTSVLYGGKLYIRDAGGPNLILDAGSGSELGAFGSNVAPAFSNGVGLFVAGGTLAAERTSDRAPLWSFKGDGGLASAPLVAGNTVYEGSTTGGLFALDRDTGTVLWSDCLAAPVAPPDEQNVSQPLTGLAAGNGLLVVPAGRWLVAYEPRPGAPSYVCSGSGRVAAAPGSGGTPGTTPAAQGVAGTQGGSITLSVSKRNIRFGQVVTLTGKTVPGARVDLQSDPFPTDAFTLRKSTTAGSDGSFSFRVRPDRNTAFKAVSGGSESPATVVYTDIDGFVQGKRLSGGRTRILARIGGPVDLPYGGKALHFYVHKRGTKVAHLVGTRRLRGRRGLFSAAYTGRFRTYGRRLTGFVVCIHEAKPDAWGRSLPADRACGAKRLRLP
ncbi:MAG: hypothetical protein QOC55_394 [Thermoleophilaceae bacterium]|nr:hypothetical protein [Thermoleophilaceae bacterium]